jgi:hypothetical protein
MEPEESLLVATLHREGGSHQLGYPTPRR